VELTKARWLAAFGDRFLLSVKAICVNLAVGDFRQAQIAEERHQVSRAARACLPLRLGL